jgi:hypothetical protein
MAHHSDVVNWRPSTRIEPCGSIVPMTNTNTPPATPVHSLRRIGIAIKFFTVVRQILISIVSYNLNAKGTTNVATARPGSNS